MILVGRWVRNPKVAGDILTCANLITTFNGIGLSSKRLILALCLGLGLTLTSVFLAPRILHGSHYCVDQNKVLSDNEIIQNALAREVEIEKELYRYAVPLPEGYSIGEVEHFLASNPNCCWVLRDEDAWNDRLSKVDQWLFGPRYFVRILIDGSTNPIERVDLNYIVNECGVPHGDRSYGVLPFL